MAAWQDLASELIMEIMEYLDDFNSISLTSRHLHIIAERFMYRSVDLRGVPQSAEHHHDVLSLRMRRFLRTLVQRPELGTRVRYLTVGDGVWCDRDYEFYTPHGDVNENKPEQFADWAGWDREYVDLISKIAPIVDMSLGCILDFDVSSAALLLLSLHYLPRLHLLELPRDARLMQTLGHVMCGLIPGGVPSGLKSLQVLDAYDSEVVDAVQHPEDQIACQYVEPILSIPNLEYCCLSNIVEPKPDIYVPRAASSVQHLELRHCNIESTSLQALILAPKELKSFTYVVSRDTVPIPQRSELDCSLLSMTLRFHAASLTTLIIRDTANTHNLDASGLIGSLREFPVLQHVKLCAELLLAPPLRAPSRTSSPYATYNPLGDLLPPSLVTLELWLSHRFDIPKFIRSTGCPQAWREAKTRLPACEEFTLHYVPQNAPPLIKLVTSTFAHVGITLSLPVSQPLLL